VVRLKHPGKESRDCGLAEDAASTAMRSAIHNPQSAIRN
jgi:hypothetical protein